MSFFAILLLVILCFILMPLFRVAWAVFKMRKQVRDAFRQMNDAARGASQQAQEQPRAREKKIDANVGEYVEFEEISADTDTAAPAPERTDYPTSSQIEDAEWEEV